MPELENPSTNTGPGDDPEELIRAAFPRAEASEALRRRVAQACLNAAPVQRESWYGRFRRRRRARRTTGGAPPWTGAVWSRAGAGLLAAALVGGAMLASRRPATSPPAAPTAGELIIRDPEGRPAGLCPLEHTDVNADIAGSVARVHVYQQFHNPSDHAIEAVYTFPLPDDAAVDAMRMVIGDRVINGEIRRREEARQVYEAAKSAGKSAALLDQERPNIFTQSVANIMPGAKVTISISYVNLLKYDEGGYSFVFPMVVGPRYTGPQTTGSGPPRWRHPAVGDGRRAIPNPQSEFRNPQSAPPGTRAGHDISLTVNLDAGVPIRDLRSELHPVTITAAAPNERIIQLKNERAIPNRDFILRYKVAGDQLESGLVAHADRPDDGYFTLVIQPPAAPAPTMITPKEMVFVIDQTGSQAGWPIAKAKETMRYCLHRLNPGDTFQLIGFNTELFPCFRKPAPATPENVAQALKFLEPLEGNGGTDILKSVDYALSLPDDPARLRIVCYMTDGYVGDDMQILDYIRKHRGRARMFPFGVGDSVNRFLIDGMAREGRGAAEYVTLQTPGEEAAERFYRRIASPVLVGAAVDWNGLPVKDVYPRLLPDLFSAGPLVLYGRYANFAERDIVVHGLVRGRPWRQVLHVKLPPVREEGSAIPTLWAREKIEELQSQDWMGAQTGQPNPRIHDAIVETALKYRLMSQWTSFVAVEQKVVNHHALPQRQDVPVELPEGVSDTVTTRARTTPSPFHYSTDWTEATPADGETARGSEATDSAKSASAPAVPAFVLQMAGQPGRVSETRSMNNLHQVGAALSLYQQDYDESFPASRPTARATAGAAVPAHTYYAGRIRTEGAASVPAQTPVEPRRVAPNAAAQPPSDFADGHAVFGRGWVPPATPRAGVKLPPVAKIAPALNQLAAAWRAGTHIAPGPLRVKDGRVEIEVTVDRLPADGPRRLKALGFVVTGKPGSGKQLRGTVPLAKLEQLAALEFVRRVDVPRVTAARR